jgi:hypothetical protein
MKFSLDLKEGILIGFTFLLILNPFVCTAQMDDIHIIGPQSDLSGTYADVSDASGTLACGPGCQFDPDINECVCNTEFTTEPVSASSSSKEQGLTGDNIAAPASIIISTNMPHESVNIPSPSAGQSYPYLFHGQQPSMEELREIGGDIYFPDGIQLYILYNDRWCQDGTSYWSYEKANMMFYSDQPQYIVMYERYPNGQIQKNDIGYVDSGYNAGMFMADSKGLHTLAVWGSRSGWSNQLQIYVQ